MSSQQPPTPRPTLFLDTETTGLDPRKHHVWEIAAIRREPGTNIDTEYHWQVRADLTDAAPEALEIGRYEERFAVPDGWDAIEFYPSSLPTSYKPMRWTLPEFLFDLQTVLKDAVIVGSNPAFDDAFLKKLLHAHNRVIGWHYRTVDIVALAVGHLYGQAYTLTKQQDDTGYYDNADALLADGWRSYELSALMGVEPPLPSVAHTALGDARWARDVYDAITKPNAFANRTQLARQDAA